MILSALYGLVDPEDEIETHDVALDGLSAAERDTARPGVDITCPSHVLEVDPAFIPYFDDAKTSVAEMTVQFIALADPVERTLFEVYAAIALDTAEFNSWETH